jgi:hypothetical protein
VCKTEQTQKIARAINILSRETDGVVIASASTRAEAPFDRLTTVGPGTSYSGVLNAPPLIAACKREARFPQPFLKFRCQPVYREPSRNPR